MRTFRALSGVLAGLLILGLMGFGSTARAEVPTVPTELRLSAPSSAPAGSSVTFSVRLLTSDGPVSNRTVLLQRQDPSGWVQVGSMTTRSDGLGQKALTLGSSARFRGYFRGDASYDPSTSPEVVVTAQRTLADRALAEAKRHQGQPYQWGADGPTRFDCSGFTRYVFSRLGRSLPHNSGAQKDATRRVANGEKKPGDLIFTYSGSRITHVGLYAGGTSMWSPVKTGDHVRLQSFSGRTYAVGRVG
jgi:cell wall-associated NlpC family hydrolase